MSEDKSFDDGKFHLAWFLTENNPEKDSPILNIENVLDGQFKYIKVSSEVGESGTPHLHAYICLSRNQRFSYLKKRFPRANIQPRKKPHLAVKEYVGQETKSGSVDWVREFGDDSGIGSQGYRKDIDFDSSEMLEAREKIKLGKSLDELYEEHFLLLCGSRYGPGLLRYYHRFHSRKGGKG